MYSLLLRMFMLHCSRAFTWGIPSWKPFRKEALKVGYCYLITAMSSPLVAVTTSLWMHPVVRRLDVSWRLKMTSDLAAYFYACRLRYYSLLGYTCIFTLFWTPDANLDLVLLPNPVILSHLLA